MFFASLLSPLLRGDGDRAPVFRDRIGCAIGATRQVGSYVGKASG